MTPREEAGVSEARRLVRGILKRRVGEPGELAPYSMAEVHALATALLVAEQENERLREGLRRIEIKAHDDLLAAEQENERLRTALMEASLQLDAAGCQVAASDAHQAALAPQPAPPSVQKMAAAFDSVTTDDSQDEPPDFDVPNDDFGGDPQPAPPAEEKA